MDKREPSLVPEWLRSTVGSKNQILSSSARSDSSLSHTSKSRNPRNNADSVLSRSSSTNERRNGSTKNAYSNFNVQRSHRGGDKDRSSREKSYVDPWDHDTSFPFGTFLNGRNQEQLRRSNSMTQGFTMGSKNGISIYNRNGILSPAKSSRKPGFFGKGEMNGGGGPEVVRISSPGLSPTAVQSLTSGEGWTSALAEVPIVVEKTASDSVATSVTSTGQARNMAEALLQPPRTGTPPQVQSLEERALKQSRQLIPVVPSSSKSSVSSDKSKTKPMARSGETGFRNTHQHSSIRLGNLHPNSVSQIKPDTTKKLVVLKPAVKESGAAASQMIAAAPSASVQSTNNPMELKGASVNMTAEKKHSIAQTRSRNAFFSALKKTATNISAVEEKADISKEVVASDPSSVQAIEKDLERVEKVSEALESVSVFESADLPDEKEAEFLKSLGWDENNTEVEALTDEEIRAFYEQHKEVKPSLMQKLPIIKEATEDATPNS